MNSKFMTFPDLGNEAKLLKISVDLEALNSENFLGAYILKSLKLYSIRHTVRYIREYCKLGPEFRELVEGVISAPLLQEIETVEI